MKTNFEKNKTKQLEMLQLINFSYEMTDIFRENERRKERHLMMYGRVPQHTDGMAYLGEHFKKQGDMEGHDGNLYYTKHPKRLSEFLRYEEGPNDGICDPKDDPYPANVNEKRRKMGERQPDSLSTAIRDYEWVGKFSNYGAVEGNVFNSNFA